MTSTGDCCRGDMCTPISSRELRQTLDSLVPDCHDGRLRALLERLHIQAAEPGLQHGMRSFPFPFDNASLPPTLLLRTRRFHHQVLQASAKTPDAGLEILTLRGSLERWVLLSYAPSDPQSLLIREWGPFDMSVLTGKHLCSRRRIGDDGCPRYLTFTVPLDESLSADVRAILGSRPVPVQ